MNIKLLILDVDGTMTDGGIYYDDNGNETKRFAIKDGAGLVLARAAGIKIMICTGRECPAVTKRAADLHLDYVYQDIKNKREFLVRFLAEQHLPRQAVAYCGDDLNDLGAMQLCGFVACPADAAEEVLRRADYVCPHKGGAGAVRDAVEHLLKQDGIWEETVNATFPGCGL